MSFMMDQVPRSERMAHRDKASANGGSPVRKKRKMGWGWFAVLLVGAMLAGIVGREVGEKVTGGLISSNKKESINTALERSANAINRQGPRMVDSVTRLNAAVAGPGKYFRYEYTVLGARGRQMSQDALYDVMTRAIVDGYCTGALKTMRSQAVIVTYRYRDEDKRFIGQITVRPSSCT